MGNITRDGRVVRIAQPKYLENVERLIVEEYEERNNSIPNKTDDYVIIHYPDGIKRKIFPFNSTLEIFNSKEARIEKIVKYFIKPSKSSNTSSQTTQIPGETICCLHYYEEEEVLMTPTLKGEILIWKLFPQIRIIRRIKYGSKNSPEIGEIIQVSKTVFFCIGKSVEYDFPRTYPCPRRLFRITYNNNNNNWISERILHYRRSHNIYHSDYTKRGELYSLYQNISEKDIFLFEENQIYEEGSISRYFNKQIPHFLFPHLEIEIKENTNVDDSYILMKWSDENESVIMTCSNQNDKGFNIFRIQGNWSFHNLFSEFYELKNERKKFHDREKRMKESRAKRKRKNKQIQKQKQEIDSPPPLLHPPTKKKKKKKKKKSRISDFSNGIKLSSEIKRDYSSFFGFNVNEKIILPTKPTIRKKKIKKFQPNEEMLIGGGAMGLLNLGNTCFMNSVLQCLLHTDDIVLHFGDWKKTIISAKKKEEKEEKEIIEITPYSILSCLRNMVNMLYLYGHDSVFAPTDLLEFITSINPRFGNGLQHDAQEFFNTLRNSLENESFKNKKNVIENPKKSVDKDEGLIQHAFGMIFRSIIICDECKKSYEMKCPPEYEISVPIYKPRVQFSKMMLGQEIGKLKNVFSNFSDQKAIYKYPVEKKEDVSWSFSSWIYSYLVNQKKYDNNKSQKKKEEEKEETEGEEEESNKKKKKKKKPKEEEDDDWSSEESLMKEKFLDPKKIFSTVSQSEEGKTKETTLRGCLWEFFKLEKLCDDNAFYCEHCSKNKKDLKVAYKQLSFAMVDENGEEVGLPRTLVFHLKRFSKIPGKKENSKFIKNFTGVEFPMELSVKEFISHHDLKGVDNSNNNMLFSYRLFGIIEHLGTMEGGHYVAYVCPLSINNKFERFRDYNVWLRVSDSTVEKISKSKMLAAQPYILFYEKIMK